MVMMKTIQAYAFLPQTNKQKLRYEIQQKKKKKKVNN
jgi:hypothetical protein